jgi:hypothetical protein
MLMDKSNYKSGDIIGLKLVNGDELIAKLIEFDSTKWVLEKPCVVVGGAKGIGLMQAMFSLDPEKSITVKADHVMMSCDCVAQMRDHYIQVTTGIQPVSKGSIIV